jgi:DNA-directed RNA polymerase specialized sigma24 family protein
MERDAKFFDKLRDGDAKTYDMVFRKFYAQTFKRFFLKAGHLQNAEDLNQDLWLRILVRRGAFPGNTFSDLFFWLKRGVHRIQLERGTLSSWLLEPEDEGTSGAAPGGAVNATAKHMVQVLSALPEADQDVLLLLVGEERISRKEALVLLEISEEEANERLCTALVRYGRALRQAGNVFGEDTAPHVLQLLLRHALAYVCVPAA